MPLSKELQRSFGTSYVPRLDVKYQIKMDIDRLNRHIDLVVYITGDGFPNCEAFITDPGGRKIFIGVHVRKGAAPVTLALNLDYPMIVCALRIPIDVHGNFMETVGDELARHYQIPTNGVLLTQTKISEGAIAADKLRFFRQDAPEQLTEITARWLTSIDTEQAYQDNTTYIFGGGPGVYSSSELKCDIHFRGFHIGTKSQILDEVNHFDIESFIQQNKLSCD